MLGDVCKCDVCLWDVCRVMYAGGCMLWDVCCTGMYVGVM